MTNVNWIKKIPFEKPNYRLNNLKAPDEIACILVPRVLNFSSYRIYCERTLPLPECIQDTSDLMLEGLKNFEVTRSCVLSMIGLPGQPDFKMAKIQLNLRYCAAMSNNSVPVLLEDSFEAILELPKIYYPDQPETARFESLVPSGNPIPNKQETLSLSFEAKPQYMDGCFEAEEVTVKFGINIVISVVSTVRLLVPSYGNCPPGFEKELSANDTPCLYDAKRYPFPGSFYPKHVPILLLSEDDE